MVHDNEKLGHQTEGVSQLLTPEFSNTLEHYCEGLGTNDVLNGTFSFPENTSEATRDFITVCTYNPNIVSVKQNNDISARYNDTTKLWTMRKEKPVHMGSI